MKWLATLWVLWLALVAACTDSKTVVDPGATGVDIDVALDGSLGITQVRIADADAAPHFAAGVLPEEARPLAGAQSLMLLLSPDLDGTDLLVRLDALAGDRVVATGAAHVVVRAGKIVDLAVALGPPQRCGDGALTALLEACDDGNTQPGDGCSASCGIESGYTCDGGSPTTCHPDTFDVVAAASAGNRAVVVTFSAPPDPAAALDLASYTIPGLQLSGTPFLAGASVTLTTSTQTAIDYNVLVAGVTRAGDHVPLTETVAGFTGRTAFGVASARSTSATAVAVTYDAVPSAAATDPASYRIPGLTIVGTPVLAGTVVTLATSTQAAIDYTVTVAGVTRASDGEALDTAAVTFTGVNGFDVASAVSTSNRQLQVTFNAPPNAAQATLVANYSVPGLTLTGPVVLDGMTVTIETSAQTTSSYTVTVAAVTRASDGQALSNTAATFVGTPVVAPTVTAVDIVSGGYNTAPTVVTITGAQFASVACPGGVHLDDRDGADGAVNTAPTACTVDSDGQITATFPRGIRTNGSAGWNVIVTNSAGANSSSPPLVMRAGLLVSEAYVPSFANHEFVELYNPTSAPINVGSIGLKLHVRSAVGADTNKALTIANAVVPAHGFMLLASSQSNASDPWFAKKDATYVAGSGIGANGGVYLSLSATANVAVLDKVGWGTQSAGGYEGTALADIPPGSSAARLPAGGAGHATDTDVNLADFAAASTVLTPHGTADPPQP